jgi:hypothetical protein
MLSLLGFKNSLFCFAAILLTLVLVSCGGGGVSNDGQTGTVALLLTDAATDDFAQVNVTITRAELISDSLKVTILSTTKTVDLLKLEDETTLFALSSGVPSVWYEKIRLYVSNVELVKKDGITKIYPKLPGGGKIDLNPRGGFFVKPGGTLLLQVDLDANKSIHVVKTGSVDKYIFRPVVFIDILDGHARGKLLRLYGQVRNIDHQNTQFELCPPQTIYHAAFTYGNNFVDAQHNVTTCVPVYTSSATSFFNTNGDPVAFGDLAEYDLITAVGNIRIDTLSTSGHDHDLDVLGLDAVVIEWGKFLRLAGIVKSLPDPVTKEFDLELFPGQGFPTGTVLVVELQNGTKVYSKAGVELSEADIAIDLKARIDGVLLVSNTSPDIFKAALAVLFQHPFTALNKIGGTILNLDAPGLTFDLFDSATSTTECVEVQHTASIFLITITGSSYISEEIGLGDLSDTQSVQIYGDFISSGCFSAHTILASPL